MPTTQILPIASEGKPPAGKCLIIVERKSSAIGAWVSIDVYDNETHVGTLNEGGKLVWLREHGPMRLITQMKTHTTKCYRITSGEPGKEYRYIANIGTLGGPGVYHVIDADAGPPLIVSKYMKNDQKYMGYMKAEIPRDLCWVCGKGNFKPECPAWASHVAALAIAH